MAITKAETQITWSAANSVSVSAGSSQTSDAITLDATCFAGSITLKADNSTTAAADDIIYFYLLGSSGDPDGTGADEYDTTGHAGPIAVLDTSVEDPALTTATLPEWAVAAKSLKLFAEGSTAGSTNAITVSATIYEHRAA